MIIFTITCVTVLLIGLKWSSSGYVNSFFKWLLYSIAIGCITVALGDWIKAEKLINHDDTVFSVIKWTCLVLSLIWTSKGRKNTIIKAILIAEAICLFLLCV